MSTFVTQSDVMVRTAGHVDDINNQVQGELNRLRGTVDSVKGNWAGAAQASFDQLMVRWDTSAKRLQDALASIGENIRANARSFDAAESGNVDAFKHAGAGLDL